MSLFNKIEIDHKIIPFIQRGEGVGVVKTSDFGKCSARLENNLIILESYEIQSEPIRIPLTDIKAASFEEGNFINEPKAHIATRIREFVLAGVDNNDDELRQFFNTIVNIKNNEKRQKSTMPHPTHNITNPNKNPNLINQEKLNNNLNQSQRNPNEFVPPSNQNQQEISQNFPYQEPENSLNNEEYINDSVEHQKPNPADEIRKYYELKEDGIITEEEFEEKKKQLLKL